MLTVFFIAPSGIVIPLAISSLKSLKIFYIKKQPAIGYHYFVLNACSVSAASKKDTNGATCNMGFTILITNN